MAARPTTTTTTGSTTEHVGGGGPGTANPAGYYWDAPLHWVGGHVQARGVLVPVPAFTSTRSSFWPGFWFGAYCHMARWRDREHRDNTGAAPLPRRLPSKPASPSTDVAGTPTPNPPRQRRPSQVGPLSRLSRAAFELWNRERANIGERGIAKSAGIVADTAPPTRTLRLKVRA